ncbi:MAG: LysE family transporter [Alphaproteobacteria bacterium]
MDSAFVVLGAATIWLLAVVSPGPNTLIVSQMAIARSRAAGLGATFGIAMGALTYAALTLFGLSIVLDRVAWLNGPIRIAGGAYLIYLGIKSWRGARGAIAAPDIAAVTDGHLAHGIRVGLLTSLTNPKSIAFFVGLFAAAVPAAAPLWTKLAVLAAGGAIELGWYAIVATALSAGRARALYLRTKVVIDRTIGGILVLLGCKLLLQER